MAPVAPARTARRPIGKVIGKVLSRYGRSGAGYPDHKQRPAGHFPGRRYEKAHLIGWGEATAYSDVVVDSRERSLESSCPFGRTNILGRISMERPPASTFPMLP